MIKTWRTNTTPPKVAHFLQEPEFGNKSTGSDESSDNDSNLDMTVGELKAMGGRSARAQPQSVAREPSPCARVPQPTTPVAESPSREPSLSAGEAAVLTRLLCAGELQSATPAAQILATTTEQSPAWEPSPQASKPQPVWTRVTPSAASASAASVDHCWSQLHSDRSDSTDALNRRPLVSLS